MLRSYLRFRAPDASEVRRPRLLTCLLFGAVVIAVLAFGETTLAGAPARREDGSIVETDVSDPHGT